MKPLLFAVQLRTPLGVMLALAEEKSLLFLDFVNREMIDGLNKKLARVGSSLGPWELEEARWDRESPAGEFAQEPFSFAKFERRVKKILQEYKVPIQPGINEPLRSLEQELERYFLGELKIFQTPYRLLGSPFQQRVWEELLHISYGKRISYAEEALRLDAPTATRAVANANGANLLALIVPCHRVIASNGKLGGYGSGLRRKQWLLDHEEKFCSSSEV